MRFTASIRNDGGTLTIADWNTLGLTGPEVSRDVLECVRHGLPTGRLELAEPWSGASAELEYDLEMTLEGTDQK